MNDKYTGIVRDDVIFRRLDDEMVLIHLGTDRMFALNLTGADFWELLADGLPSNEIRTQLLARYDVDGETLDREIGLLLQQLRDEGFLLE